MLVQICWVLGIFNYLKIFLFILVYDFCLFIFCYIWNLGFFFLLALQRCCVIISCPPLFTMWINCILNDYIQYVIFSALHILILGFQQFGYTCQVWFSFYFSFLEFTELLGCVSCCFLANLGNFHLYFSLISLSPSPLYSGFHS